MNSKKKIREFVLLEKSTPRKGNDHEPIQLNFISRPKHQNGEKTAFIVKQHRRKAYMASLFQQMATRVSKNDSQRLTGSRQIIAIRINHKQSIAFELSIINYWGIKPVYIV